MADRLLAQVRSTTERLVDALGALDDAGLRADSELPGWSRLTVACHLRYGARALRRMTDDTAAGRATSYYPGGRVARRPSTLRPDAGESPVDVVRSLRRESERLHERWGAVDDWDLDVREPAGMTDLGVVPLRRLAVLRLTEVEVHGTDLGLGLGPWSDVFVAEALPMRLAWLAVRRSNHREVPEDLHRSWLLVSSDGGPVWRLEVDGSEVRSAPADSSDPADAVIEAPSRELLALLLGRSDLPGAEEFGRAFPGP